MDFWFTAQFYLRPNGRINLRLNNFTFYKHLKARSNAHRWSCTAYGSKWKCKAHLIITDKLEVLKAHINHSHPPSVKKPDMSHSNTPKSNTPKSNASQNVTSRYKLPKVEKVESLGLPDNYYFTSSPLHRYLMAHSVFNNTY